MAVTRLISMLLLFTTAACGDDGVIRKLNVTQSPGCMDQLKDKGQCDAHPLVYVTATSSSDTVHMLVSLWSAPSCLLLRTPLGVAPNINWTRLVSSDSTGAITAGPVTAAYGLSWDKLIEFEDPSDSADLAHANATTSHGMDELNLPSGQLTVTAKEDTVLLTVKSPPVNSTTWGVAGTVAFTVEVLNSERRTEELPHLQQTGYSLVAGVVLDGLKTDSSFQHSRFGVDLTTVGNETQALSESKSLDDEYTPGVFKLVSLAGGSGSGFLQWRPVAYTAAEYTIEHSTTARHYNVSEARQLPASPLLRAFFVGQQVVHQLPITFGLSEDGWYKDAKYAAWELTAGLGSPPKDEFSLMVILLLGIGLGLPTVALIGGGIWMAVRRIRGGSTQPSRLLVDEQ